MAQALPRGSGESMNSKELTIPGVLGGKPFTIYYELDRFIQEVLVDKEYDKIWKDTTYFTRDDLVVVDVGCNIGTFSLSVYDKASKIYAIDFVPSCVDIFKKTIEANNLDKISVFQQAITDSNERVTVTSLDTTDGGPAVRGPGNDADSQTLYAFCEKNGIDHIDVLKLDVEGAEVGIMRAPDFSKIRSKIGIIIGEHHGGGFDELLKSLGYIAHFDGRHFLAYENRTSD